VIAVNSASFAYVEVPLNGNLAIIGTGNLGKSSIVNCVRFFLLPEVNVNDSDRKFAFISGAGDSVDVAYFNKDQIYEYYFPDENSRLILEVEHKLIDGTTKRHCQIISRGDNYRLQRCFIAESYDTISHLFWDKSTETGAKPEYVPGRQLLASLKKINNTAKQVSQVEQLTKELYSVDVLRPNSCPYVLFPLRDISSNAVDSLRALVKMLFNQDSRSLRLMTATAIEGRDDGGQLLEVDISEIINEQKVLKKRKSALEELRQAQPKYEALKTQYQNILNEKSAATSFAQLWVNTQAYKQTIERQLLDSSHAINEADAHLKDQKNSLVDLNTKCKIHQHRLKELNELIDKAKKTLATNDRITTGYPGKCHQEIVDIYSEDLEAEKQMLKHYTDAQQRQSRLQELDIKITDHEAKLDKINRRQSNKALSLRTQLTEAAWRKLYSINSVLANANPGRELNNDEFTALNDAMALFNPKDSELHFFDEKIPFLSEMPEDDIDRWITSVEDSLSLLVKERRQLQSLNKNLTLHDQKKIGDMKRNIEEGERELKILRNASHVEYQLEKDTQEYEDKQAQHSDVQRQCDQRKGTCQAASDHFDALKKIRDDKQTTLLELANLLSGNQFGFGPTLERYRLVKIKLREVSAVENVAENDIGDANQFNRLAQQLEASSNAKVAVSAALCSLITHGLIVDSYQLLTHNNNEDAITKTFEALRVQFDLLGQNNEVLKRDTLTHNDHVRNRLERLSKTKEKIELTISDLNCELAKAKVNDLESVKLKVKLNAHFDDLNSEGTLPEEWYARLEQFLQSDAVNNDGKLRMDNIIQQARYLTKKIGEVWDEKDQSTSTKMLINMHFCDIFIQQLSNETSEVAFPLIMDEIGKVSSEQFPELIKSLNDKGHWLVGVTTHGKSGDLIAPFENYLVMDELKTANPYHPHRRHVCFSLEMEQIKLKEQADFFRAV